MPDKGAALTMIACLILLSGCGSGTGGHRATSSSTQTSAAPPASTSAGASTSPSAGSAPNAVRVTSLRTVGALFQRPAGHPALDGLIHTCSASVVHSPAGDLILAAAHCVTGSGRETVFVPGYHDGKTPYGIWDVIAAYVDPAWTARQDPARDFAVLRARGQSVNGQLRTIEDVVGGAVLASAPRKSQRVTVGGYVLGSNDQPLTCTSTVCYTGPYPSFDCGGLAEGTSGGPWLTHARGSSAIQVVGLIGGLHQGGCTPSTSYSPPLGLAAVSTLKRAAAGGKADVVPPAGSDGC